MDVCTLVNLKGEPVRTLHIDSWDLDERADSTNRLSVDVAVADATDVYGDMEVLFHNRRFVISQVDRTRSTLTVSIDADEAQAEMASIELQNFKCENVKFRDAVSRVLEPTLWKAGQIDNESRRIYADLQGEKVTDLLQWLASQASVMLRFDSANRVVDFLTPDTSAPDKVFTYRSNLSDIKKTETPPTCTVLHPIGANGLTVRNVNDDSELVEDFGWYMSLGLTEDEARARYTKRQEWEDQRYTVVANLLADAKKKLAVTAYPTISYDLSDAADIDGLSLGQRVYVWDNELGIRVSTTVSRLHSSASHSDDSATLDYLAPSFTVQDDDTTGDTTDTSEAAFFQAFNTSDFTLGSSAVRVLPMSVDLYSDTSLEVYACLTIKTTTAGDLDGYWLLNGERAGVHIRQTCAEGWTTIGVPFLITNVSSEAQCNFDLYLSHSGAASLAVNDCQVWVRARGAYGGITNERPDQRVIDRVSRFYTSVRHVSDAVSVAFPELARIELTETVARFMPEMRAVEDCLQPIVWLEDVTLTITNATDGTVFNLELPDKTRRVMPAVTGGSTTLDLSTMEDAPAGRVSITIVELGESITVTLPAKESEE